MNSVLNDIPLFVDWLAVSLQLQFDKEEVDVLPIDGCSLVEQTPTNVWKRRALIINERGDKMLTVLWSPKSSIIHRASALLEVANEWLYHGRGAASMVREFVEVNGAVIMGVSRVDLAADFVMTPERERVVFGLADRSMYVGGKRSGSGFWSVSNDFRLPERYRGKNIPHCQSWGHKTSGVKWKLYYKWKELCEAAGSVGWEKTYIVDEWCKLGMPPDEVWRLEVSIRHCNGLMKDGFHLTYDKVMEDAIDIYRALYCERFVIRENQGHADRSNDDIVQFLPVDYCRSGVRCSVPVADQPRNAATSLLRQLIKSLDELPILCDEQLREGVMWQIENICTSQHLVGYASAIVDKDIWTWIEDKRVEASKYVTDF